MMARTGAGDERVKLERALKAHNNAHISTIHGAPNEVGKSQDIQFLNLVDNAAKFDHNTKVLGDRTIARTFAKPYRETDKISWDWPGPQPVKVAGPFVFDAFTLDERKNLHEYLIFYSLRDTPPAHQKEASCMIA